MIRVVLNRSNNLVYLNNLEDVLSNQFVNTADVEVTFFDDQGVKVAGETWPLTLQFQPGSNGDYVATVDDDIVLVVGGFYSALIVADDGPGKHLEEVHKLEIVERLQ